MTDVHDHRSKMSSRLPAICSTKDRDIFLLSVIDLAIPNSRHAEVLWCLLVKQPQPVAPSFPTTRAREAASRLSLPLSVCHTWLCELEMKETSRPLPGDTTELHKQNSGSLCCHPSFSIEAFH